MYRIMSNYNMLRGWLQVDANSKSTHFQTIL